MLIDAFNMLLVNNAIQIKRQNAVTDQVHKLASSETTLTIPTQHSLQDTAFHRPRLRLVLQFPARSSTSFHHSGLTT